MPRKKLSKKKMAKIRKLVCINCGNTEEFIVDSKRNCASARLYFDGNNATLEDDLAQDIDIFPSTCAKCGAEILWTNWTLKEKKAVVCNKCDYKFECFTTREEKACFGFRFKEEFAEVE